MYIENGVRKNTNGNVTIIIYLQGKEVELQYSTFNEVKQGYFKEVS